MRLADLIKNLFKRSYTVTLPNVDPNNPNLKAQLTSSPAPGSKVKPGTVISYSALVSNSGVDVPIRNVASVSYDGMDAPAESETVTLYRDGTAENCLISCGIPAGTSYLTGSLKVNGEPYILAPELIGSTVFKVILLRIAAGGTARIEYLVKVS